MAVLELHLHSQFGVADDDLGPRVLRLEGEELAQRRRPVPPHPLAVQTCAGEWGRGWVNSPSAAGGSQEVEFTQPMNSKNDLP